MYKQLNRSLFKVLLAIILTSSRQYQYVDSCIKSDSGKYSAGDPCWIPMQKTDVWWQSMHSNFVENSKTNSNHIKVVFFGDSITQGWTEEGNATFHKFYDWLGAVNYGISADRTEHLLWRIKNGEIDEIRPKLLVLLIGTNNLSYNKDSEIYTGIKTIVHEIRRRLPRTKIILLGILPRNSVEITHRVLGINKMIMQLDDGIMVWFFDLGRYFFIEDRFVTELYHPDLLHLSSKGYEMWAFAMDPVLKEMLELYF